MTLRPGTSESSWAMVVMPCSSASRGERNATARPSTRSSPASGETTPATILPRVDLPAPFSPDESVDACPRAKARSASLTATVAP